MCQSLQDIHNTYNTIFDEEETAHADFIISVYNNKKYFVSDVPQPILLNIIGDFYKNVKKEYTLMKIYYLSAISKGFIKSMVSLGNYYHHIEEASTYKYDLMKKYYLMAIDSVSHLNNGSRYACLAMYNLGDYYNYIEKNY